MQSRMSAQKLAASRRTFGSLITVVKKRKASVKTISEPLYVKMKPRVKLENDDYLKQKAEFMTAHSRMLNAKRQF